MGELRPLHPFSMKALGTTYQIGNGEPAYIFFIYSLI